jgi:predicted TIM-barrel fold metal-dependent hydrolase
MIPIFDSLTHPTLTGKWFSKNKIASFHQLLEITNGCDVAGFCTVGLPDTEEYDHALFLEMISASKKSVAIAGINPYKASNISHELNYIKHLGYKAIKLHPRIGCYNLDAEDPILIKCFEITSKLNLIIFLCTFTSASLDIYPDKDPYWELVKLLKKFPKTRCVLLHGGVTRLLQYAELVRFNRNLLLDLSYTIIKFKNSSIDLDIQYLFSNLDQCICIGTDYPEYNMVDLRNRLKDFEPLTSKEKLKNIYHKNLQTFLGINS